MIKKTICVDFDGVLNEYDGYEEGDLGEPLTGSKEFIKELRKKYKVVISMSMMTEKIGKLTDFIPISIMYLITMGGFSQ